MLGHKYYADAAKIPENKPANDGIIDDENSGFTIKSIPKIAIIIAVIWYFLTFSCKKTMLNKIVPERIEFH